MMKELEKYGKASSPSVNDKYLENVKLLTIFLICEFLCFSVLGSKHVLLLQLGKNNCRFYL